MRSSSSRRRQRLTAVSKRGLLKSGLHQKLRASDTPARLKRLAMLKLVVLWQPMRSPPHVRRERSIPSAPRTGSTALPRYTPQSHAGCDRAVCAIGATNATGSGVGRRGHVHRIDRWVSACVVSSCVVPLYVVSGSSPTVSIRINWARTRPTCVVDRNSSDGRRLGSTTSAISANRKRPWMWQRSVLWRAWPPNTPANDTCRRAFPCNEEERSTRRTTRNVAARSAIASTSSPHASTHFCSAGKGGRNPSAPCGERLTIVACHLTLSEATLTETKSAAVNPHYRHSSACVSPPPVIAPLHVPVLMEITWSNSAIVKRFNSEVGKACGRWRPSTVAPRTVRNHHSVRRPHSFASSQSGNWIRFLGRNGTARSRSAYSACRLGRTRTRPTSVTDIQTDDVP